jgi:hypothetical protein
MLGVDHNGGVYSHLSIFTPSVGFAPERGVELSSTQLPALPIGRRSFAHPDEFVVNKGPLWRRSLPAAPRNLDPT